jgi:hypothetical protein
MFVATQGAVEEWIVENRIRKITRSTSIYTPASSLASTSAGEILAISLPCYVLSHEDAGLMAIVRVQPGWQERGSSVECPQLPLQ